MVLDAILGVLDLFRHSTVLYLFSLEVFDLVADDLELLFDLRFVQQSHKFFLQSFDRWLAFKFLCLGQLLLLDLWLFSRIVPPM